VIEEPEQQWRVKIAQCEVDRRPLQALLGIREKESEGVVVGLYGARRNTLLRPEVLKEEVLQERGERRCRRARHRAPSRRANASKRQPVMAMSSGTAEKYQYVEVRLACPRYCIPATFTGCTYTFVEGVGEMG